MTAQLALLPTEAPELRHESLPLAAIDGFADASPSAKLRELIRDLGLLQPVVVVPSGSARFRVVEGRRRCRAIAQLAETGEWARPPHVDALVIDSGEAGQREVGGGLTLALHASRSASPASELAAIETILRESGEREEAVTVKEIAGQTGMSLQTVRRRLRLRSLIEPLRDAFDAGRLSAGVAEAAARLPEARQRALGRRLDQGQRLTFDAVREIAREETGGATAALPAGLFADRAAPWQATVRGHLDAALAAVPEGQSRGLTEMIASALAALYGPHEESMS
jgi:ParB family chromosome partitioning protein